MKLGIMQPYFLPYIGYFQLIAAVDTFIIYDNIKYTKKGWINRNRMLLNGTDVVFSVPLAKDSDSLDVVQRQLALDFDRSKLLKQFEGAYSRAPYFSKSYPLLERIVRHEDSNLFRYIRHSITELCAHIGINTEIIVSSEVAIDHALRGQAKVIALCNEFKADTYINAIGGVDLYSEDEFRRQGIILQFLKSMPFDYKQFENPFVPWLSIVDLLMFNSLDFVSERIHNGFDMLGAQT